MPAYNNKDRRIVRVSSRETRMVRRLRRRAERRELRGENVRSAVRATRRGWWYA
jgi:hypothetical protein